MDASAVMGVHVAWHCLSMKSKRLGCLLIAGTKTKQMSASMRIRLAMFPPSDLLLPRGFLAQRGWRKPRALYPDPEIRFVIGL